MCVKVFFSYMKHALVGRKYSGKISARIQLFYNCNNKTVYYNCNTIILRTPSYLGFRNFTIFKESS